MSIEFDCECGRVLRATEASAGKRGRCPTCAAVFTVPTPVMPIAQSSPAEDPFVHAAPEYEPEPDTAPHEYDPESESLQLAPAPPPIRTYIRPPALPSRMPVPVKPLAQGATDRGGLYWFLLLAFIPLIWSTVHKSTDSDESLGDRVKKTVQLHPDIRDKLEALPADASGDQELAVIFDNAPDHKLEGALLPHETYGHWGFAIASAAAFLALILVLFPRGHVKLYQMALVGIFTGTVGILLLLGFQWLAFHMGGFTVPRGVIGLLILFVEFIGFSYRAALGDSGFLLSAIGFTFGVGFCEEVCKAIPLIFKARTTGYESWRSAMLWGLISGVGFGVSEGITYSSDYYNGLYGPGIYLVRFISCVGLHAIWAAAAGVTIFRRQDFFRDTLHPLEWIMRLGQVVIVPMVLHGFYDTLLKQHYDLYALLDALISFAWLAWQIELAKRHFDRPARSLA